MLCKPWLKGSWIGGEHSPVGVGNEMNCCFQVSFLPIRIDDSNSQTVFSSKHIIIQYTY